jgi:hypothetical protein
MALPTGWPPRPAEGRRNIRFYVTGTATTLYSDNAFLFSQGTGANKLNPTPILKAGGEATTVHNGDTTVGGTPSGGGVMTDLPSVKPMIWAMGIRVINTGGADINISFDGVNPQGLIQAGKEAIYNYRHEAGIAVKAVSGSPTFVVEAW